MLQLPLKFCNVYTEWAKNNWTIFEKFVSCAVMAQYIIWSTTGVLNFITVSIFFALVRRTTPHKKCSLYVTATYLFFNLPDVIEASSNAFIETFITLQGVRLLLWIPLQWDILCTSAVKWRYTKNNHSLFLCHLYPCVSRVHISKNPPSSSLDINCG